MYIIPYTIFMGRRSSKDAIRKDEGKTNTKEAWCPLHGRFLNPSPKATPFLFSLPYSLFSIYGAPSAPVYALEHTQGPLRRGGYMERKTPQSSAFRETAADSSRLAVPEKCVGLTLILAFFDRCGNSGLPFSATGGGSPQFPLGRGAYKEGD